MTIRSTSFAESFARYRVRGMFPSAEVEVMRSAMGNYSRVSFIVDDRDLMHYDRERTVRELDRRMEPKRRRKHWSLFKRGRTC